MALHIQLAPLTPEQPKAPEAKKYHIPDTPLHLFIDGACKPNPGNMFIGLVLNHDNVPIWSHTSFAGYGTNNKAEFSAALQAMKFLAQLPQADPELGKLACTVVSDSEVLVGAMNGNLPKDATLRKELMNIHAIQKALTIPMTIVWVPRMMNQAADDLSKQAFGTSNGMI